MASATLAAKLLVAMSSLAVLAGCASNSPPSEFYILNSLYSTGDGLNFSPDPDGVVLGIGPVTLPDHLDRPQIVTRSGLNRLDIDEFHRWGGELEADVIRVMAQNLSFLLDTDRVRIYPWSSRTEVAYQVQFDLVRMDGTVGREALVRARWRILEGEDGPELASHFSTYREPVSGPGYGELVAAESRALQRISGEIADRIKRLR